MPFGNARFNSRGAVAAGGNTQLLLKFEGTGTTLVDSSNYARTNAAIVTDYGSPAAQDTSFKKFGAKGLNGVQGGTRVRVLGGAAGLVLSDLTMEAWVLKAGYTAGFMFGIGGLTDLAIYPDINGFFDLTVNGNNSSAALSIGLSSGSFVHVCVQRTSGIWRCYFDGSLVATINSPPLAGNITMPSENWWVNGNPYNNYFIGESFDEFRLSSVSRYNTAGFSPPTSEFVAD